MSSGNCDFITDTVNSENMCLVFESAVLQFWNHRLVKALENFCCRIFVGFDWTLPHDQCENDEIVHALKDWFCRKQVDTASDVAGWFFQ